MGSGFCSYWIGKGEAYGLGARQGNQQTYKTGEEEKGRMVLPEKDKIIAIGKKKNGGLVTL